MTDAGSDKPDEPPRPPAIVPVLLIMVSSLSILSGDLYLPSMPLLQTVFSADAGQVQLTISLNLAGFALGMLVWGPASDRFGRRPMFVVALVLFALASLACAAAPSISTLIAARFLQGAAASAEVALGFAVIRDLYRDKDAVRLLALLGMVIAVVPMLGPVAGGYILAWFGWQANFILLAAGGGVAAVAIRLWLPESNPDRDRHALRPYVFLSTYARIWWNRQFVVMAGLSGLGFAMLMTFITVAPFYVIDVHGYAPETYGIYQGAIVAGYIVGSLFAHRMVARLGLAGLLTTGVWVSVAGGVGLVLLVVTGLDGPLPIAGPMSLAVFGLALIFATAPLQALTAVSGRAGAASAALGTTESGIASLAALAVGLMSVGSAWPIALGVAIPAAGALALLLVLGRRYLATPQAGDA